MTDEYTDDQQIQDEGPLADAKRLEPEITARTHAVLHNLRRQLSKSQQQQALDKFIDLIAPTFAYGGMGDIRIPVKWRKGGVVFLKDWWKCLTWEVSKLIVTYWNVIREGEWKDWEEAVGRIEEMVDTGISNYLLAPLQPNGFYLVTKTGWAIEKKKRERKKRLLERQRASQNDTPPPPPAKAEK